MGWALNAITRVLKRGREKWREGGVSQWELWPQERHRESAPLALQTEEGATRQRTQAPPGAGKGEEQLLSWSLQKEPALCHLDFGPVRSVLNPYATEL